MAAFRGWTVVEEIPSGGQGDVFKVRRPRDASEYALKRLKNPDRMERFEREIEVTKRLHEQLGSSFPEIVETGADRKGRPYYVMSWLEGSLQREVDRGLYREQIPDGLARLIELADVLAALHATELAHRDLKPANVLADACGRLVLADFGLAIEAAELADPFRLTASDEAIGSRYYIAPENEDGASAEVDQRPCDCYAFGKMIWVLLVGKRPLSRETQLEPPNRLVDRLGDDRLAALDGLCSQLLARDPRARLGDWPLIRTELVRLRASLSEGPIQTAAPDDADLAAAITSARVSVESGSATDRAPAGH